MTVNSLSLDFVFWIFFASYIPDCFLEKLATQKHHWEPGKISQSKACSHYPQGAPQQEREFSENNHSTLAKYHRKKTLCLPHILLWPVKAKWAPRLHPCQGGRQRMRHPALPPVMSKNGPLETRDFHGRPTPSHLIWVVSVGIWTSKPAFLSPHWQLF